MPVDTSTPSSIDHLIARLSGEIHAHLVELRRAGLPPKALAGLEAIERKFTLLADALAGLGEPEPSNSDAA
jgi:hypothetical protein